MVSSRLDVDSTDSLVCLGTYTRVVGNVPGTTWLKSLSNYIGELEERSCELKWILYSKQFGRPFLLVLLNSVTLL